jgi:hypothetical protein
MQPGSISGAPADVAEAHRSLLADKTLQFDLTSRPLPKTAEAPEWLKMLGRLIEALSGPLQILFWGMVALAVLALIYFIVREATGLRWRGRFRRGQEGEAPAPDWRPTEAAARLLLAEADRLAAAGRFADAAHHLLLHSIQEVEDRRPRSIRPAFTSREIARLNQLPAEARTAFGRIAAVVETSLFGGRPLGADEFADCRKAYQDFALPGSWA